MAIKIILVIVLIITSVVAFAYPTNARSLIATKAKAATTDEQKEYIQHTFLPPFLGGFGGLRGGIRPPFGLGGGIGGLGGGFGFGPFVGGGGTNGAGAGVATGSGSGSAFGSGINQGFGDNGGNNPNIDGELGAGDLGEGGDATLANDMMLP